MKHRWWVGAALATAVLLIPQAGDSCGPFLSAMQFTTYHGLLDADLESGHLGVVRPHFWRRDLLLVYRAFSGVSLTDRDDASDPPQAYGRREEAWLAARKEVAGAPVINRLETDRKLPGADFQEYPNCLDGAFGAAVETLHQRVAKWGSKSPEVLEWLRGQDQVFQNCSGGATTPAPIDAPADLAADRRYQMAAAEFYAEQYAKAAADFDRIAADHSSPWHEIAPYLAARACIRQTTIGGDAAKAPEAVRRLEAILQDPAAQPWHDSAKGLLNFVRARLDPQQRLVELGDELLRPDQGPQLGRVLTDYTRIWDRLEEIKEQPPVGKSDVAAWIAGFQGGTPPADSKKTLPWLVASLVWVPLTDARGPELIRAAQAVPPSSPAYATAAYYGILRQIRSGQSDAARQWADDALGKAQSVAAANMLRSERLRLARGWQEFLRYAPRKPVGSVSDAGSDDPLSTEEQKANPMAFDRDATESFNQATPLTLWVDAVDNQDLPANLRGQLAQAGWVRAVLLDDVDAGRKFAQRLMQLKPELAEEIRRYLGEKDRVAAHFTAVFLLLRGPGLEPVIRPGFPRGTPMMESDPFRDNWLILKPSRPSPADDPDQGRHQALHDLYGDKPEIPVDFLPKDQRAAGEAEWQKLVDHSNNLVNYLCAQAIAWAMLHPQDPRVPQALHEAVTATHYGSADKESSTFSKQAFDLLHRRYPNSEWTRQTKYWY